MIILTLYVGLSQEKQPKARITVWVPSVVSPRPPLPGTLPWDVALSLPAPSLPFLSYLSAFSSFFSPPSSCPSYSSSTSFFTFLILVPLLYLDSYVMNYILLHNELTFHRHCRESNCYSAHSVLTWNQGPQTHTLRGLGGHLWRSRSCSVNQGVGGNRATEYTNTYYVREWREPVRGGASWNTVTVTVAFTT